MDFQKAQNAARLLVLRRAFELKPNSGEALYALAYALADQGEYDEFALLFERAFLIKPDMLQPSPLEWPETGRLEAARKLQSRAQALQERGVTYSPVLAGLAIAYAILKNAPAVRQLLDPELFFRQLPSIVPRNWNGDNFCETLSNEIKASLKFHDRQVMRKAWRNDEILTSGLPASTALLSEIHHRVEQYIQELPSQTTHPFVKSCPKDYTIDGWAIVTSGEGHLSPHIHPRAWLNGIYYVRRPNPGKGQSDQAGCLRLGPPENLGIIEAGAWPANYIQPDPGTLVLMPGYYFHSTVPTNLEEERICVAFNVYSKTIVNPQK